MNRTRNLESVRQCTRDRLKAGIHKRPRSVTGECNRDVNVVKPLRLRVAAVSLFALAESGRRERRTSRQ